MRVNVGLIDFRELPPHVAPHEDTGYGVVIETDEIEADVYTANALEDVSVSIEKLLHQPGCMVEITGTIYKPNVSSVVGQQFGLGLATYLNERVSVGIKDSEHFVIDACAVVARFYKKACTTEIVFVVRLSSLKGEYL